MTYDAVVIGGGPGGYETALWVAKLGGKAVVVEKDALGGVCTNRGCIPTKALAASCDVLECFSRAEEFGVKVSSYTLDSEAMFKRRDRVSLTMRKGVEKLLADAKVDVVRGVGTLKSETEVEVNGEVLEGRALVLATGSEPVSLPGMDLDHEYIISGDDAAALSKRPESVVIVGGGFVGCEYASIYSRMGCDVTLIEMLPRLLPLEDKDVSAALEAALSKKVSVMVGTKVESIDVKEKEVVAGDRKIRADLVLMAVGRRPVLPAGIDDVGVVYGKSGIKADSMMRTSVDNIYAVGDVTQGLKLAHVAYFGAQAAARNIMGDICETDWSSVPWCVFTSPEVARVGKTSQEAGSGVRLGRADYLGNGKARCMGERGGFCKVVVDEGSGVILGVHIVGAHASDLIGEAAVAVRMKLKAEDVAGTVHPHPTLSEIFKEACGNASE
jgi:dihydrolipoamide dehydrogenase